MNNTVVLRNDGSNRVLISEYYGGRNPYTNYIEVTANTDYKDDFSLEIKDFSYRLLTNPSDTLARWVSRDSGFSPATHYVSLESIEQAEWILRNHVNVTIPELLEQGKNHPAYTEMIENMEFYNLPSTYETDFYYHDTLSLANNPVRFIWILRDGGTHFISEKCDWNMSTLTYDHNKPHYFMYDANLGKSMSLYEYDKDYAIEFYLNYLD